MSSGSTQVDFTFHNISIPISRSGYGLQIDGNSPVTLSNVMAGSVADGAGAKAGDYLIVLNGKDVQFATGDEVSSTLKYSYGSALEIRVARPHPLPVTDLDRRRAILTLQTKLRTGDYVTCGDEVENYKSKLSSALADVDDILGGFDLPGTDQQVPSYGGSEQVVEVKFFDGDNLSSPPSSKGSEVDVTYDPLLDFDRDDGLVHRHGNETTNGGFAKSIAEMQREMDKMKDMLKDVSEKSGKNKKPRSAPQKNPPMRTEAAFTPNYPSHHNRTQPAVTTATSDVVEDLEPFDDQVRWVDSPLTSRGHTTSAESRKEPARQAPKRPEKSPPPKPIEKSVSPPPRQSSPPEEQPRSYPSQQRQKSPPPRQPETVSSEVQPFVYQQNPPRHKSPPPRKVETSPPKVQSPLRQKSPPPSQPGRGVSPPVEKASRKPPKRKDPKRTKSPPGRGERSLSPEEGKPPSRFGQLFRSKDKKAEQLPSREPEGYVEEVSKTKGRKREFGSTPASDRHRDVESPTASLPPNVHSWRKEEVELWIKSISMSLYALYYPMFSKHHITGQSLLRLSGAKLKMMGITNSAHCRTLATEIARLKIQQERTELRELQGGGDKDERKISEV